MSDANDNNTTTDDRKRLIDEFWAAEKKVGEPIKVEVGRMVFGERQRTRDRKVADAFIEQLPHSARQTHEQGTEEYRLCDMYESLTVQGWDSSMPGFALKVGEGEDVEYKLLAGNTRYLMLDHLATAGNNDKRYTHGWVRVVEDENDALVIAEGHNLISETVRPPPDLGAFKDVLVQRLKALKGTPQDFLRELGVGLQHNVASFVKKLLILQTEVNAIPAKQEDVAYYAKSLLENLMEVVAEHIARLSRGPSLKQSAGTSKWSKINPKVPAHEGEEEASKGNGYRTLVDSPSEHDDKTLHFTVRVEAFALLVNPRIAKLSKTQSDVDWLIGKVESLLKANKMSQEDDVRAALQSRLESLGVLRGVPANDVARATSKRGSKAMDELAAAAAATAAAAAAADGPQQDNASQAPEDHSLAKTAANACTHCSYCSQETPWHCPECLNRRATCIYICSPQTGRPCFSRHCQGGGKKARKGSI
ncbi:hypothetical protein NFJ02_43g109980 [Pycnococcus provasolii]